MASSLIPFFPKQSLACSSIQSKCDMSRRKTLKKAQYYELANTYDNEHQWPGEWRERLGHEGPITLELGCGKAEFALGMARNHPDTHFIGIDVKADRMGVAGRIAREEGLTNLSFLRIHLTQITDFFAENEVDELWITFPDPFPKNKQVKHRMMNASFLALYRKILKPGGRVHYKTDNIALFHYSLEVFVKEPGLVMEELTFNLHADTELPDDTRIRTTYEKKFMDLGFRINYTKFRFDEA